MYLKSIYIFKFNIKVFLLIKNNKFNLFLFIKKIFDDTFLGMINLD